MYCIRIRSKNSKLILERLELQKAFDVIVDGTMATKAKPDPEVFRKVQRRCILIQKTVLCLKIRRQELKLLTKVE